MQSWKRINNYNLDGEQLFIANVANNVGRSEFFPIRYYTGKCSYSDLLLRIIIKEK